MRNECVIGRRRHRWGKASGPPSGCCVFCGAMRADPARRNYTPSAKADPYVLGHESHGRGKAREANPFRVAGEERELWFDGWDAAATNRVGKGWAA